MGGIACEMTLQMTYLACGIRLVPVSYRAKLVLLGVVLAAIMYVLISPLPELAATSSLKLVVLPLLLIMLILISGGDSRPHRIRSNFDWPNSQIWLAQSCVMLC